MVHQRDGIGDPDRQDARTIWDYHHLGHPLHRCDAAIGLGSHDLGVAGFAAKLYRRGLFPVVVFSGGNSPTTVNRFPRGEAVHYRERALELGVPDRDILLEPRATNTGQNITFSRALLLDTVGVTVHSVLLVCKPYTQRRAYATCRKVWPDVDVRCASEPLTFDDYVTSIGNERLVIDMLVGDLQRIVEYPRRGFTIPQDVPAPVHEAYERLRARGFTSRILREVF